MLQLRVIYLQLLCSGLLPLYRLFYHHHCLVLGVVFRQNLLDGPVELLCVLLHLVLEYVRVSRLRGGFER